MKRILIALVASIFMGVPNTIQAHGDRAFHYNDVARILNGFGTPDYKDAKKAIKHVSENMFSPNAAPSTIESEKAFAGFAELLDQVSCKMEHLGLDPWKYVIFRRLVCLLLFIC